MNKTASLTKKITQEDVKKFSVISGDNNPLHLDPEYAKKTRFKKPIAHGILVASHISALIGNTLPGNGSIYISQTLNFINPVFINDIINTKIKILEKNKKNIYTLDCKCYNQSNIKVIEGIAKVLNKN